MLFQVSVWVAVFFGVLYILEVVVLLICIFCNGLVCQFWGGIEFDDGVKNIVVRFVQCIVFVLINQVGVVLGNVVYEFMGNYIGSGQRSEVCVIVIVKKCLVVILKGINYILFVMYVVDQCYVIVIYFDIIEVFGRVVKGGSGGLVCVGCYFILIGVKIILEVIIVQKIFGLFSIIIVYYVVGFNIVFVGGFY